jgi:hypothetical protein
MALLLASRLKIRIPSEFGKSIFNPGGAKQQAKNALKVGPEFF